LRIEKYVFFEDILTTENNKKDKESINLLVRNVLRLVGFKQLVKLKNLSSKLFAFDAYEVMQGNIPMLVFVNQLKPTTLMISNPHQISWNRKHLV